jgi:hypothetical protein
LRTTRRSTYKVARIVYHDLSYEFENERLARCSTYKVARIVYHDLSYARKEGWSLLYMARMIAFDHDLKNGKKSDDICNIHQKDVRRQEMTV